MSRLHNYLYALVRSWPDFGALDLSARPGLMFVACRMAQSGRAVLPRAIHLPTNLCPFKFTATRSFIIFGGFFIWFLSLGV